MFLISLSNLPTMALMRQSLGSKLETSLKVDSLPGTTADAMIGTVSVT